MDTDYGRRLGARLRSVREALKLDRDEVAARTGGQVTPATLKNWEYGLRKMDAGNLEVLGAAYGVAVPDLVPR